MTFSVATWDAIDEAIASSDGLSPDQLEQIKLLPKLKFITGEFEAEDKAFDGILRKTLHCTASSTITDLHGDSMTQECVEDMARQARKGLTIYLNHKYSVPEDVFGKVFAAQARRAIDLDENKQEIWDLDYDIVLTKNNARVDQTYRMVKDDGIRLGVSIGAYILEYDFKDEEAGFWGGLIINRVLLVETSIVGIPANQRSWVQNGVIAIGKHLGFEEKQIRRVLDGKEAVPTMKTETADVIEKTEESEPSEAMEVCEDCGLTPDECKCNGKRRRNDAEVEETNSAPEAQVEAEAAPEVESPAEPLTESEPDETVEETPAEASADLEEAAPEIALTLAAGSTPAVEMVLAALESAAATLKTVREEKANLQAENEALRAERDQAIKDRDDAAEIIELVARSPLGRKTQFAAPVQSFVARFSGIYDAGFLKLIEPKE